jgi:histone deacetylase 11
VFAGLIIFSGSVSCASFKPDLSSIKSVFAKEDTSKKTKIPIIYSTGYDISFYGLQKLHPFDTCKYSRVHDALAKKLNFTRANCFCPTGPVSEDDLLKVHTKDYFDRINTNSSSVARVAEVYLLAYLPNFMLRNKLLHPMRLAIQGTIEGIDLAFKHGWAINLSGGYHHAKPEKGEGFCFFADIPLAIIKMRENEEYKNKKVLIIDLDAHHGNGHAACCKDDPLTFIFDVYNKDTYPILGGRSKNTVKHVQYNYPIAQQTKDDAYLTIVQKDLKQAIERTKPDLIIYNAGTDILEHDPVGRLSVSREGIIQRDKLVFGYAEEYKIPILMTLSGGYTSESAGIIAESIERNLGEKIQELLQN